MDDIQQSTRDTFLRPQFDGQTHGTPELDPAREHRGAAPAAGERPRQRRARPRACDVSRARPAGGGDEPVPLRTSRRCRARLRQGAALRAGVSVAHLGAALRPHRSPHRRAGGAARRPRAAAAGGRLGRGGGAGGGGARAARGALCAAAGGPPHPHQCRIGRAIARRAGRARCRGQAPVAGGGRAPPSLGVTRRASRAARAPDLPCDRAWSAGAARWRARRHHP